MPWSEMSDTFYFVRQMGIRRYVNVRHINRCWIANVRQISRQLLKCLPKQQVRSCLSDKAAAINVWQIEVWESVLSSKSMRVELRIESETLYERQKSWIRNHENHLGRRFLNRFAAMKTTWFEYSNQERANEIDG